MRWGRLAAVVVAGLVVAGAGGWWLAGGTSGGYPVAAAAKLPLSGGNVRFLERSLDSSSPREQAGALAPPVRGAFIRQHQLLLPAGTKVNIEPKTFKAMSDAATVNADTSIGKKFTLRLTREKKTWLILYTIARS